METNGAKSPLPLPPAEITSSLLPCAPLLPGSSVLISIVA